MPQKVEYHFRVCNLYESYVIQFFTFDDLKFSQWKFQKLKSDGKLK